MDENVALGDAEAREEFVLAAAYDRREVLVKRLSARCQTQPAYAAVTGSEVANLALFVAAVAAAGPRLSASRASVPDRVQGRRPNPSG